VSSLVRAYQLGISPFMMPHCRFVPSCSEYVLQAYAQWPFLSATRLAAARLCRCHPWGTSGFDPVPVRQSQLISSNPFNQHVSNKDA